MRKADELSMTTAPARCAIGANCFAVPAPALKKARSTPAKESRSSAATWKIRRPRNSSLFPADRGEASSRKSADRKITPFHHAEQLDSDRASRADDRDVIFFAHRERSLSPSL